MFEIQISGLENQFLENISIIDFLIFAIFEAIFFV